MNELELDPATTRAHIDAALGGSTMHSLRLSKGISPTDLIRLIVEMRSSEHSRTFLELLACVPLSAAAIWRALLLAPVDPQVAMTALNNPTIPDAEVDRLRRHTSTQVRGHALLNHLQRQLPHLKEAEIEVLLDSHSGDEGVSLGVRHLLARSPRTPRNVLVRLADDDADFIADCARRQLEVPR